MEYGVRYRVLGFRDCGIQGRVCFEGSSSALPKTARTRFLMKTWQMPGRKLDLEIHHYRPKHMNPPLDDRRFSQDSAVDNEGLDVSSCVGMD